MNKNEDVPSNGRNNENHCRIYILYQCKILGILEKARFLIIATAGVMKLTTFFEEMTEQSEIKSEIISKYFGAWTRVIVSNPRVKKLGYVDLFAGPGRYEDGTKSTPIKVLEQCIAREDLRQKMVTVFNDANPDFASNLQTTIDSLPGIASLTYRPTVQCSTVGNEIVETFERQKLIPSLAFVDPWGYKGLSSKLIAALIKDWGSDCIFFFNYNRINMGINNPVVVEHMNSIFGEERAEALRVRLQSLSPVEREMIIVNDLAESLSSGGANYVLPFRFIRPTGERTSHYLIFVSKHPLGYKIMKDIMWRYSSDHEDGVASFFYVPVHDRQLKLLFDYSRPLDELGDVLLNVFQGKTLTVQQIYDQHNVGTPFVMPNYKEALRRLEEQGRISANPPAEKRKIKMGVRTFSEKVRVSFP